MLQLYYLSGMRSLKHLTTTLACFLLQLLRPTLAAHWMLHLGLLCLLNFPSLLLFLTSDYLLGSHPSAAVGTQLLISELASERAPYPQAPLLLAQLCSHSRHNLILFNSQIKTGYFRTIHNYHLQMLH